MSAATAETPAAAAGPGEPYRGIEEFRFVDAPIFFGRQNEASALLRLVTIYRGVLLFGDSGVGKSSLINAGLMPMAVEDGFAPERIRVQPKAGEEFVIERIAPADDSHYLPSIFADNDDARRIGISAAEFRKRIAERCGRTAGGVRPILVLDQFEELVTLTEQRASAVYDTITATLLDLLREETLPVKLLFVFREDHYAKISKFFARYPNLSDHSLRLEPLHVRELRTIIEGPFQSDAVSFDHALPEPVIESLVAEFTARSESDLLNLSEVQIASLRLWRDSDPEKTLKTLGVRRILEAYFENAIDVVPAQLRHAAIALLTRMVTSSNTRNVVSAEELIADLGEEEKISSSVGAGSARRAGKDGARGSPRAPERGRDLRDRERVSDPVDRAAEVAGQDPPRNCGAREAIDACVLGCGHRSRDRAAGVRRDRVPNVEQGACAGSEGHEGNIGIDCRTAQRLGSP